MSPAVTDVEGYFGGRWRLEREIFDESGARIGGFQGSATFTLRDGVLVYHEQGMLELGTHCGPAHRTLHYRVTGPGQAGVYFDHGGFFHDLDLRAGRWRTSHPCADDLYRGEYQVLGPDRWQLEWTVAGPTKNHTLISRYRREPTG
jgi:Family of unknown function (DUF6314)